MKPMDRKLRNSSRGEVALSHCLYSIPTHGFLPSPDSGIYVAGLCLRDGFITKRINLTAILRNGIYFKGSGDVKELTDRKCSHALRGAKTKLC